MEQGAPRGVEAYHSQRALRPDTVESTTSQGHRAHPVWRAVGHWRIDSQVNDAGRPPGHRIGIRPVGSAM
jgi:hypothetical protein